VLTKALISQKIAKSCTPQHHTLTGLPGSPPPTLLSYKHFNYPTKDKESRDFYEVQLWRVSFSSVCTPADFF